MDPAPTRYIDREGAAWRTRSWWAGGKPYVRLLSPAEVANTAYLQRRGFGLSDPIAYTPTVEPQADDLIAVMDEVGMRRATLVGVLTNCGAPALVAARRPERVSGLVLVNPVAQGLDAPPGTAWGGLPPRPRCSAPATSQPSRTGVPGSR